jgi:hypothetical protein
MRAAQPTWAAVTSTGAQKVSSWTTVTNGKKEVKKHPLDQRRILFVRNVQPHTCDPRDKGNLTGVMGENACAEGLFAHAQTVMAVVHKLDPKVVCMDKTEKWCKLRVHGVALDRYMAEGGLDLA